MRLLGTKLAANSSHRGFGDQLYDLAGERPSLDLNFANQKSLVDATTGQNLVTFTRASSGTYVGSDGLIKTATTNLLLRSEEFNDAYWTKSATSITANDIASPVGTITADKLVEDSANSQHTIGSQSISWLGNTQYTFTLYAKAAGRDTFDLLLGTAGNWVNSNRVAIFNLTSGVVEFQDGSPVSASIQNIGGGWFRCRVTATTVASPSASAVFLRLYDKSTATGGLGSYQGNGSSGVHLWGAQLEQSSTVGEYIPTTSTINSAPRFDHNPTTGESLGLLVEEQRTNVALHSEQFDNAAWSKSASSVTANTSTAPDGATTADKLVNDSSTGEHSISGSNVLFGGLATGATFSCYAKAAELTRIAIGYPFTYAVFDLSAGVVSSTTNAYGWTFSSSIQKLSNGWYRCSVFVNTNGTAFNTQSRIWTANSSNSVSYAGDGISGVYLWGAQLEAGAFPTSYIPTTTAAATRSADVASISGSNFSSWYRQDEGTVFADAFREFAVPATAFPIIFDARVQPTDIVQMGYLTEVLAGQYIVNNTVTQSELYPTGFVNARRRKLASAYALNNFAICGNGNAPVVDSLGTPPSNIASAFMGSSLGGGQHLNGTIRRLTYWPQRLSNTSLQQITQ